MTARAGDPSVEWASLHLEDDFADPGSHLKELKYKSVFVDLRLPGVSIFAWESVIREKDVQVPP